MHRFIEQPTTQRFEADNRGELVDPQYYNLQIDPEFVGCRQRLISNLISLSRALDQQQWDIGETLLQRFCQRLIKYLTLGHERASHLDNPNIDLYVAISTNTRMAMCFSDRYSRGTGRLDQVRPELEKLALALETRFELEDDLQAADLVA